MNFAAVIVVVSAFVVADGKPDNYKTAYQKAHSGNKPLQVLVTAEWCPPCRVMKSSTIPSLLAKNAFKNCNYATVDLDAQESLARKLIGNRGVPQLIMYEKKDGKWLRRYLSGIQTPETVEAFIAQAASVRLANAKLAVNKK